MYAMDVLAALADDTRRSMVERLARADLSAAELGAGFAISQPAASKHLRVLREAGLVSDRADGRHRVYELITAPLGELTRWLEQLTRPSGWQHHLDALETEVYRTRRERRTAAAPDRSHEETA